MKKTLSKISIFLLIFALMLMVGCDSQSESPQTSNQSPSNQSPSTQSPSTQSPSTQSPSTRPPFSNPHTHSYGEWIIAEQPNCQKEGRKERSCSCGVKQTEKISKTQTVEKYDVSINWDRSVMAYVTTTDYSSFSLEIHGSGAMHIDYYPNDDLPWATYRESITSIFVGEGVTKIAPVSFYGFTNLKQVNLPNTLINIGEYAFYNCKALTNITLPTSIKSIGEGGFEGCSSLSEVNIYNLAKWCQIDFASEKSNPMYYADNLLLNDNVLSGNISITEPILCIPAYTFKNSKITSISLPDTVISIYEKAFFGSENLTQVLLGKNTSFIGSKAFYCKNLKTVQFKETSGWYYYPPVGGTTRKVDVSDKEYIANLLKDDQYSFMVFEKG